MGTGCFSTVPCQQWITTEEKLQYKCVASKYLYLSRPTFATLDNFRPSPNGITKVSLHIFVLKEKLINAFPQHCTTPPLCKHRHSPPRLPQPGTRCARSRPMAKVGQKGCGCGGRPRGAPALNPHTHMRAAATGVSIATVPSAALTRSWQLQVRGQK